MDFHPFKLESLDLSSWVSLWRSALSLSNALVSLSLTDSPLHSLKIFFKKVFLLFKRREKKKETLHSSPHQTNANDASWV